MRTAILAGVVLAAIGTRTALSSSPGAGCTLARSGGTIGIPLSRSLSARTTAPGARDASAILRQVADIPLPGAAVRFDYQSADPAAGQLYISHMNDGHIVAFDTRARRVIANIPDMPRVTGVWVVPELRKLYASVPGHHHVAVIDLPGFSVRATPGPAAFPDGIAYAPPAKRIFVSDESGERELVIDGVTDRVVATVPLGGEAGNTKYDPGSGCILVAVQTRNEIVAIDPSSAAIVARFAPAQADRPHGMYVDAPNRLLFVANQGNATVELVDLATLEVTSIARTGDDPDVLAFDPEWRRLYVATEGGGLWAYRVRGRELVVEGVLDLPHAHTVSVDPATHEVFLPLQSLDGKPTLRIMAGLPPASAVPPPQ
ncbi:MAG TPA: YncE family protein [Gemmatimonadales bacterium]|nr:YncE family protein [Gemmatimonadales bacterium]